jgi:galactose-1-phosphate uridylyltransferase
MSDKNKQEDQTKQVKQEQNAIKKYEQGLKFRIMTTRFDNKTEEENRIFREKKNIIDFCTYGTPIKVSEKIKPDTKMIILEMNNETNKIIGIGLVLNKLDYKNYNIYENSNYNRYCYIGRNRIFRSSLTEEEELIIKILDKLCFEGKLHSKRGQGLKAFPTKILYRCRNILDIETELVNMFKTRREKQ